MKHLLYSALFLLAACLGAAACSNDDTVAAPEQPSVPEKVSVKLDVNTVTGAGMRVFADGTKVTTLRYAVYDGNGKLMSDISNVDGSDFSGHSKTIDFEFIQGNIYTVVLWADAGANSCYSVDFTNKTMTVGSRALVTNDDNADAFYCCLPIKVESEVTLSAPLKRPFAQLNIGTDDLATAAINGFNAAKIKVKVTGVPNTLNLLDGSVSGNVDPEYATSPFIGQNEAFPMEGYDYLSMNYLLVGSQSQTTNVTITLTDESSSKSREYSYLNIPISRNIRTNLFGSLLTTANGPDISTTEGF